jgi:hypothetical protein
MGMADRAAASHANRAWRPAPAHFASMQQQGRYEALVVPLFFFFPFLRPMAGVIRTGRDMRSTL